MTTSEVIDCLPIIYYAVAFAERGRLTDFLSVGYDKLCEDDYFGLFWECINITAKSIWEDFIDECEINKWYFSDPSMMEYYRLCRVYGSMHNIKLGNNPYITEASEFVDEALNFQSYGYGYYLQTKQNHATASGIVFKTDSYFNGEFELVVALLDIMDWYKDGCIRINEKIKTEKLLQVPTTVKLEVAA